MFAGWNNYFMLLGAASGSLIGLLFVVVTLTAGELAAELPSPSVASTAKL